MTRPWLPAYRLSVSGGLDLAVARNQAIERPEEGKRVTGERGRQPKYRPDIDGLRAIAVFAVIGFHAFPENVVGGFVGVDVFFVISGFLISSLILGDLEKERFSLSRFYDRRIRRIFPALILVMAASLAIGWLILVPDEYASLGKHLISSALFVENFVLWKEGGYFDTSAQAKPMLHLWSLAIEEQFYIFWPLLLAWGWKRKLSVPIITAIIAALSFSANVLAARIDPFADYYLPITRFWELMIGGFLAHISLNRPDLLRQNKNLQGLTGIVLIVLSVFLIHEKLSFPGWWALLPALGTALVISAGPKAYINEKLLSNKLLVSAGLISYPLYLWHWPLLSFGYTINPLLPGLDKALLVVTAIIAAVLTYRLIEFPIRRGRQLPHVPLYLAGALSLLPICGFLMFSGAWRPRLDIGQVAPRGEFDFLETQPVEHDANAVGIWPLHPGRERLSLFIGDSQVAQYAERISAAQRNQKLNGAIFAVGGGCIPIEAVYTDDRTRRNCKQVLADGLRRAKDQRVSTVVIGGSWNWYFLFDGFYYADGQQRISLNSELGREKTLADLGKLLKGLKAQHKRVFLLLGNPVSDGFDPHNHIARLARFRPLLADPYVSLDDRQERLRLSLLRLAAEAGADVVDPFSILCDARKCRWVSHDGVPIFTDTSHFNQDWVDAHAGFIDKTIQPLPARDAAFVVPAGRPF